MHAHVQRLVSVVKMVTVHEECTIEEKHSVVLLLWVKVLDAKDIHKEMFPVYGGKCLPCKAVHNWVKKLSIWRQTFADYEEVEMEVQKWLRQRSEDFCTVGFDALIKQRDKCISVGGGYVEK
jgi:hypothetical protein